MWKEKISLALRQKFMQRSFQKKAAVYKWIARFVSEWEKVEEECRRGEAAAASPGDEDVKQVRRPGIRRNVTLRRRGGRNTNHFGEIGGIASSKREKKKKEMEKGEEEKEKKTKEKKKRKYSLEISPAFRRAAPKLMYLNILEVSLYIIFENNKNCEK